MQVREAMTTGYVSIPADTTVAQAAAVMRDRDVGILPVMSMDGTLAGLLTDRDIAIRVVAEHKSPDSTLVDEVTTTDIETCRDEDDLDHIAETMASRHIRRMPVLAADGTLAGIVGLADLSRHADDARVSRTLEGVTAPKA